jgi:quercetin dioxygenase-like cupin family protein
VKICALVDALRTPPAPGSLAIARGSGRFEAAGERRECSAGDAIYVPARAEHRFVDFSEDFATWVFFWP